MNKKQYREAWRQTRLLNWGSLHFSYPDWLSEHMRTAYNKRNESMYTAKMFMMYGYYHAGLKRL